MIRGSGRFCLRTLEKPDSHGASRLCDEIRDCETEQEPDAKPEFRRLAGVRALVRIPRFDSDAKNFEFRAICFSFDGFPGILTT